MPSNDTPTNTPENSQPQDNFPQPEPQVFDQPISTMDELNPNNKFFQPIKEQLVATPMVDISNDQPVVNPMDYVDNLNNVQPEQQSQGSSLKDAINDIRKLVDELNNKGLNVNIDEADLDAFYQMNISIMK